MVLNLPPAPYLDLLAVAAWLGPRLSTKDLQVRYPGGMLASDLVFSGCWSIPLVEAAG